MREAGPPAFASIAARASFAAVLACLPLAACPAPTSRPSASAAASAAAPLPAAAAAAGPALDCARLGPCRTDLGVCLRCDGPENPVWVWSDAPGSPRALHVRPDLLYDPGPDLDDFGGYPFDVGPDCGRFDFDARGFPVRTRVPTERNEDVFAWTYDARGHLLEIRIDRRPSCVSSRWGDESPCGAPDGKWDDVLTLVWRDGEDGGAVVRLPSGEERHYDRLGRMLRVVAPGGKVTLALEHDGGRVALLRTEKSTTTFRYDAAGHVLARSLTAPGVEQLLTWEYDDHGAVTRFLAGGAPMTTYTNTYRDGRLVSVRTETPHGKPPVFDYTREHDAHGLLVRELIHEPGGRLIRESRWIRDARGLPLDMTGGPDHEDYRCLTGLARHFLTAEGG